MYKGTEAVLFVIDIIGKHLLTPEPYAAKASLMAFFVDELQKNAVCVSTKKKAHIRYNNGREVERAL